jgi:uncharacterized protein YjiS (DUF1127 family)
MPAKTTASFLQARSNFLRTVGEKITAAIERRRTRTALHGLDDYMLKDMGIARSDIERIAKRTYPPRKQSADLFNSATLKGRTK